MRRIERLINLIAALLDARRPLTAEEIRERIHGYGQDTYEAFRRAFERDKESLRALGIPVETVKVDPLYEGSPDGYVIPKHLYYLPPLDLEPDEAAALRIAAGAVLGSAEAARAGLMKLQIDPAPGRQEPRVVWGADVAAEQPHLTPLYEAVVARTRVGFPYRRAGAEQSDARTVEPYGLVYRRGHWYLVGRDVDRSGVRAFKLSRIAGDVRRLRGSYEVPEGFEPAAQLPREAWELGEEEDVTAVVRFDRELRWWAEQNLPDARKWEGPDDGLDVAIPVSNVDALISWILGFGGAVEVVEPAAARARLREHLAPYLG